MDLTPATQINTFLGRFFGFCKKQRVLHVSLDIPDDSSVYFETLKESFSLEMFKSKQKPNHRPIIAFILPKYQILAKFRPKWVSGSENDSLSVSKYTELSSGISKLPCKTLCFLQKPKNRPKNVFIWPKYQIWS